MLVSFELTMPNIGSWNGKWTGEDRSYFICQNISKDLAEKLFKGDNKEKDRRYFHYNFGDGWAAGIVLRKITSKERNKLRKNKNGFCGYDWMVESIIKQGKIQ